MTTQLRAEYQQIDAVWKCLPDRFRLDGDVSWWVDEAKDRLATWNHPPMVGLALSSAEVSFAETEAPEGYIRHVLWPRRLGCGYGRALVCLARMLGANGDVGSRMEAALADLC